ncbi:lysozyme [Erwinia tracheiphila]|uniref:Lysozyme n=1 Tax=Erwinia tracheiphila TaxID=65700 RepID=A0A345CRQ6_9GAMM|nr:lysozyme [Erwinia tracheiphila]AXF76123.1 lysozyme [Erwinia tracheiphila]UIA85209.1 lysozyme [Erwinia tracheiphila]UIA93809.1 lysozyme [Erwinia tracheiphila]
MKISDNGIAFIKKEEGERLDAYLDAVGIPTIGVGHTGEVHGMPIAKNTCITAEESTALLKEDLQMTESTIVKNITAPLSQNQYDALCSLIFNIGSGAFAGSSVKRKLNAWDYKGAADVFLMWKRAGKDLDILLPRRQRERELFLS